MEWSLLSPTSELKTEAKPRSLASGDVHVKHDAFLGRRGVTAVYFYVAHAAQDLLAVLPISAMMKRDFSLAGRLITGTHNGSDSVFYVKACCFFLHGGLELVAIDVPAISAR